VIGCSGSQRVEGYGGVITDGSGPHRFLPNIYCVWEVSTPAAQEIEIAFNEVIFGDIPDKMALIWEELVQETYFDSETNQTVQLNSTLLVNSSIEISTEYGQPSPIP
jgi:hypothetical protein